MDVVGRYNKEDKKVEMSESDYGEFSKHIEDLESNIEVIESYVREYSELEKAMGDSWDKGVIRELEGKLKDEPLRIVEQPNFINNYIPKIKDVVVAYGRVKDRRVITEEEESFLKDAENSLGYLGGKVEESLVKFNRPEVEDLEKLVQYVERYVSKKEKEEGYK